MKHIRYKQNGEQVHLVELAPWEQYDLARANNESIRRQKEDEEIIQELTKELERVRMSDTVISQLTFD